MGPVSSDRRRSVKLLGTMLATSGLVIAIGWLTDLRMIAHGSLLTVVAVAFLPLVIFAIGIAIALILMAISAFASLIGGGDAGSGGAEIGGEIAVQGVAMAPGYYRWLSRVRHPMFWGAAAGLIAGGLGLWTILATLVMPREMATTEALLDLQSRIETRFKSTSRYPAPTDAGHLTYESLGDNSRSGPILDGFGRPFVYEKFGHWKVATYGIRSLGYDGARGGKDDMCVHGGTKLGKFAQFVRDSTSHQNGKFAIKITISTKARAVKELRCEED